MKERLFTIYTSGISILGFMLQLMSISDSVKTFFLVVSIILLVILLFVSFSHREIVKRKQLIDYGNRMILNTKEKLVLFGGDMSWTEDYIESIEKIYQENKKVEIFFPKEKYDNCDNNEEFFNRITELQKVGARVFSLEVDYGLRGILLDPDSYMSNDYMEIVITDRVRRHRINAQKNKYLLKHFKYSKETDRNICKSYISNYNYIKSMKLTEY